MKDYNISRKNRLLVLANKLPEANKQNGFLGRVGMIPNTRQWAEMNISALDIDDTVGIVKWEQYFANMFNACSRKAAI